MTTRTGPQTTEQAVALAEALVALASDPALRDGEALAASPHGAVLNTYAEASVPEMLLEPLSRLINVALENTQKSIYDRGVLQRGRRYRKGDLVTADNAAWVALKETDISPVANVPGNWRLLAGRGKDAR
jgi:hypothetical protein